MRRGRSAEFHGYRKRRLSHFLFAIGFVYLIFITFKFHHFLEIATVFSGDDSFSGLHRAVGDLDNGRLGYDGSFGVPVSRDAFQRRLEDSRILPGGLIAPVNPFWHLFRQKTNGVVKSAGNMSQFDEMVDQAWLLGLKAWNETQSYDGRGRLASLAGEDENAESCPSSVSMNGGELGADSNHLVFLPCGLVSGSSITLVGTPHEAHMENVPQLASAGMGNGSVWVSQFTLELQGLKVVDGEEPPRILHVNPRLRGDWNQKPVIELNTCYRMQWGVSMRCNGIQIEKDDETVDGFSKCEKWVRSDTTESKESKTASWLRRFIGRAKKPEMVWSFPFAEGRLFVLTLQAGVEGFHIFVGGRHVASFPYRPGFTLEEATGFAIKGDVDIHSVYATSLSSSHPSSSLDRVLEMSDQWKSQPLPNGQCDIFIGIISASNHFAERMAVRKTWMQASEIKISNVVARFFVALNPRKEVNILLKKEAEFFGDIVILPFIDHYELVVLKTVAICEYAVLNLAAAYIMKCDDDNFVRVNVVLKEIKRFASKRSLYMGNLNLLHRPLRHGKWAVTYEEWPEDIYPPYANGPGYVISSDIARFIVSQHANQSLRLFKMEDVSMGMWIEQFNASTIVQYSHSWKFCQHGCIDDYYTARYQSPRQMLCLWDKLAKGQAQCCNFR